MARRTVDSAAHEAWRALQDGGQVVVVCEPVDDDEPTGFICFLSSPCSSYLPPNFSFYSIPAGKLKAKSTQAKTGDNRRRSLRLEDLRWRRQQGIGEGQCCLVGSPVQPCSLLVLNKWTGIKMGNEEWRRRGGGRPVDRARERKPAGRAARGRRQTEEAVALVVALLFWEAPRRAQAGAPRRSPSWSWRHHAAAALGIEVVEAAAALPVDNTTANACCSATQSPSRVSRGSHLLLYVPVWIGYEKDWRRGGG